MPPDIEIVLEPFGEVSRVRGTMIAHESSSSWICTRAGDVELHLPEDQFKGNVNDADLVLTSASGMRLQWQGTVAAEAN